LQFPLLELLPYPPAAYVLPRLLSFSIRATGSHVPHKSLVQDHATFTPDTTWSAIQASTRFIPEEIHAPGFDVMRTFHDAFSVIHFRSSS